MSETTGIEPMDRLLGGGIPAGNSVLFVSEPVVESSLFGMHMIARQAPSRKMFVVLTSMRESAFRANLERYGLATSGLEVIDCYSSLINEASASKYAVDNPRDFEEVRRAVLDAVDGSKGCFLVVDDVSAFVDYFGEAKAAGLVKALAQRLKELGGVGAFLYTYWSRDSAVKKELEPDMGCIILLKSLERRVLFGQSFLIEKASWAKAQPFEVPFKVLRPGGVRVFVPKILVTGPYNAGKSSFIHSASTKAVSVDRIGTTVALDHGHVDYRGFAVDLFGTPGQERFDPILELLGGEAVGVVVVVDSTDPDCFPRAMDMLQKTNTYGIPCVVAANKADLPGALHIEEVRRRLGVDLSVPIIPVHAENIGDAKKLVGKVPCVLKKEDVGSVVDALFELIFFKK